MCFNPLIYNIQFSGNSDIDPDANVYSNAQNYSSDYLFCDQFNEMYNKYINQSNSSTFNLNAKSFYTNVDAIGDYLALLNFEFSILGFTETWLHKDSPPYELKGYSFLGKDRVVKGGGGVALYVHNSLFFKEG